MATNPIRLEDIAPEFFKQQATDNAVQIRNNVINALPVNPDTDILNQHRKMHVTK